MIYLTLDEVPTYCTITNLTQAVLTQANTIINSYLGDIGKQQKINEPVRLNRGNGGKLSKVKENIPLVSIDSVKSQVRTPFGLSVDELEINSVIVDEYGYLKYYRGFGGIHQMMFGGAPTQLLVTYTYGYDIAPGDLKMACGIIAQNIAKRGTFGATGLVDYDVQLTFMDDSIITSDVRVILNKYKGV